VNGRNNAPWNEKFAMDNWYCENSSLRLDAQILLQTVAGSGVAQDGQVTVEMFSGEYAETKVRSTK
jgi:lipopolysaccharide/colanic/teichoic acid biosynthesis glycosyltransferase